MVMTRSCVVLLVMLLFVCGVYVSQTSAGDHDNGKGYAVVQIEYSSEIQHDDHYSFLGGGMRRRELRTKVKLPPSPKWNPSRYNSPPPRPIMPPPPPPPSRRLKSPPPPKNPPRRNYKSPPPPKSNHPHRYKSPPPPTVPTVPPPPRPTPPPYMY